MTIAEFLQESKHTKITVGKRWLTAGSPKWVVYQKVRGRESGKVIIRTESEHHAVEELLKGDSTYRDMLNVK